MLKISDSIFFCFRFTPKKFPNALLKNPIQSIFYCGDKPIRTIRTDLLGCDHCIALEITLKYFGDQKDTNLLDTKCEPEITKPFTLLQAGTTQFCLLFRNWKDIGYTLYIVMLNKSLTEN